VTRATLADPDPDAHPDAHRDPDPDAHRDPDPDPDAHRDPDQHLAAHPQPDPDARPASPGEQHRRFEDVYAANCGLVLGYALRRTVSSDDAADVLAETFLVAWRRLDDVPRGDAARLWLYGVARRVLANQRRGEQRRSALAERLRADLAAGYLATPPPTGELADVASAFRRLPEPEQELLALVGWEGLDARQVAATLGCSPNAVRIRLHRARRRLATELARNMVQPRPGRAHSTGRDPS
jgi:RNA polymerase sigma factor (sigma-70 family)